MKIAIVNDTPLVMEAMRRAGLNAVLGLVVLLLVVIGLILITLFWGHSPHASTFTMLHLLPLRHNWQHNV